MRATRTSFLLVAAAMAAATAPLGAQGGAPDIGVILGMNVSASGTDRDTLGLLISNIARGGPADQAGIDEGNRLAAIDGVSLRIDAESVGRADASDGVFRRLARVLGELRSGDDVTARVFGGGRFRLVTLHPVLPTPGRASSSRADAASAGASAAPSAAAPRDSLAQIAEDLAAILRRLRDLQATSDRRASARPASDAIPGLTVSTIADDLAPYFGDGSESGLLVLKADDRWEPLRAGDVILRVNEAPATPDRLRSAHDSQRSTTLAIMRRKRELTLTVDATPERER